MLLCFQSKAYVHLPNAEKSSIWAVDLFINDVGQYSLINRKVEGVDAYTAIDFTPSPINWTIKLCSPDYIPRRTLEQMTELGVAVEGTSPAGDGTSRYWVKFKPGYGKKGHIVVEKTVLSECSFVEVEQERYLFAKASKFTAPLREAAIPDSPLKIKLRVAEKLSAPEKSSIPDQKQKVFEGGGAGSDSDWNDNDKPGKPYPYQLPIDDKEQQVILMLSHMAMNFSWEEVRSWYNTWQQFFYSHFFPQQAMSYLRETIADSFYHLYTIISGNSDLSTESAQISATKGDAKKAKGEEKKPAYPIEFITARNGKIIPYVVIYTTGKSGERIKNLIPAYLAVSNSEDEPLQTLSMEFFNPVRSQFKSETGGKHDSDMAFMVAFLHILQGKRVMWVTGMTGLDAIPFTPEHFDAYRQHLNDARFMSLAPSARAQYSEHLNRLLANRFNPEIAADGHCFFRAIGRIVFGHNPSDQEIRQVRKDLREALAKLLNPSDTSDSPRTPLDRAHISNLLDYYQDDISWGGIELLRLASEVYKQPIFAIIPTHAGGFELTRANPDGSATLLDSDQVRDTGAFLYHDQHHGLDHWGVSLMTTPEQEVVDGATSDNPKNHAQGASQGSASAGQQGPSQPSSSRQGNEPHDDELQRDKNGDGNKNPGNGSSLVKGKQIQSKLKNLELIETVDSELAESISGLVDKISPETVHFLQSYVDQLHGILNFCKVDQNITDPEETACDFQWLISANIDNIKVVHSIIDTLKPSGTGIDTILKLLKIQNNFLGQIPFRMTRALILYAGKSHGENSEVSSNRQLTVDLVNYLYQKDDDTPTELNRHVDPLNVSFSRALESIAGSNDRLFREEYSVEELKDAGTFLDEMFKTIKANMNVPVKKIRKHFAEEKSSTREVRERIEDIIYNDLFVLLLQDITIAGHIKSFTNEHDNIDKTVKAVRDSIMVLTKSVKTHLRTSFSESRKITDSYSKKIPIDTLEKLIEKEFLKFFIHHDRLGADGITTSISSAYGIGMLSILHSRLLEFLNAEVHKEASVNLKKVANRFIWDSSWLLGNPSHENIFHIKKMAENIFKLIKLVKNSDEAIKLTTLTEKHSKYPKLLRFAKIKAIKERFSIQYREIIKSQSDPLTQANKAFAELKEIVQDEFGATSQNDLKYLQDIFIPGKDIDIDRIEEWQLKFIEGLLLQHATRKTSEASDTNREEKDLDEYLERKLNTPSALGSLFLKLGKLIAKKAGGNHFSESKHETSEDSYSDDSGAENSRPKHSQYTPLTPMSLAHINTDLWNKGGMAVFSGNFIHNSNANHSKSGVLKELVPNMDSARRGVQNLQDWYSVIIQSLNETRFSTGNDDLQSYLYDRLVVLQDLLSQKNSTVEEDKYHIFDIIIDYSKAMGMEIHDGLKVALSEALKKHYSNSKYILNGKTPPSHTEALNYPVNIDAELMKFIQRFTYALLKNITSDQFRFMVAADLNSLEFLSQIIALLNINTTHANTHISLFKAIELTEEQMDTINSYYIRLASEHFQKLGVLHGEKFNSMIEKSKSLKPEVKHTIDQLKHHQHLSKFLKDLGAYWVKSANPDIVRAKSVHDFSERLISDTDTVIKELETKVLSLEQDSETPFDSFNQDDSELSKVVSTQPESTINMANKPLLDQSPTRDKVRLKAINELNEKIQTGKFILDYLKNVKILLDDDSDFFATEAEKQAAKGRWLKAAEWLEKNEKTISLTYFSSSLTAIYYRTFGDGGQASYYSGGGKAPFATVVMGPVAVDFLLALISVGSVVAQVSQAAGWNVDLTRKLETMEKTKNFPLTLPSLPAELKSDIIKYYLLVDVQNDFLFSESTDKNPYLQLSSRLDTLRDLWSLFCCRQSPTSDSVSCPGSLNYLGRAATLPCRLFAQDRVSGGLDKISENYHQKIRNRMASSLVRLLGENTPKSMNNMWGVSIWQQLTAILIHLIDGPIAITEINDMGAMLEAKSKLDFATRAVSKVFDGEPLSKHDIDRINEMYGSLSKERLNLTPDTAYETNELYRFRQWVTYGLANALQLGAVGAMTYDWDFYLLNPMTSVGGLVNGKCDVSTAKKMPGLGGTDAECLFARFANDRKKAPLTRLTSVISMKVGSLIGSTLSLISSNAAQGKISHDEMMLGTLIAGLLKNSLLGPLERMMQLSPEITPNTIGDVVGQLDTFLKEAIESTVQRLAPKAPIALSETGRNMVMEALSEAEGDPTRVHGLLKERLEHLEQNVGFEAMNAFAEMRHALILGALENTQVERDSSFQNFKHKLEGELTQTLPSLSPKRQEVEPGLIADYSKLKQSSQEFLSTTDKGEPLVPAIIKLISALNSIPNPYPTVDHLVNSLLTSSGSGQGQPPTVSPEPAARPDDFWEKTIKKYHLMKENDKLKSSPVVDKVD
ncbi:OTU domain-containing protein [Endozoicomonas euniceicola]|uniref:OTU domain-containing protein n=1 Tax=Endozoicomonas euniceicola TaxID=1234143 RepID=A0ABY6GXV1_9GAMM|nr:OTU domain-containing protein [Endozoicomonas euniceicola]UYM17402.1 hypothetical protein NX720_05640 [Endozoicomonas euniceicola]